MEQQNLNSYWESGLNWLLQGNELEAQALWLSVMAPGTPEQIEEWTGELNKVLEIKGQECLKIGKYEEAEYIYRQIIEIEPSNIEAYRNLGNACLNQNQLEKAIACYQETLKLNPNYALGYCNLGAVFMRQGKIEDAIAYLQHSIELNPNHAVAYYNLGIGFELLEKIDDAMVCYQQAIALEPKNYLVANNLGAIFQKKGNLESALIHFEEAIKSNSNYALSYNNLGIVLQKQGKLEESIRYFEKAIALDAKYKEAYYNLGVSLWIESKLKEAVDYFSQAIELEQNDAEAHWNRGLILLQMGDYKRGFEDYEWRWRRLKLKKPLSVINWLSIPQPLWSGENLKGKTILLHAEQGFGDTIQFIRYAPLVQQHGGDIVIECHKSLVRLLASMDGIKNIVTTNNENIDIKFDVHASLMSLPKIMGTTLETIPQQIPYLIPPSSSIEVTIYVGTQLKIGIVWASGYYKDTSESVDFYRVKYCPPNLFFEILNIEGISLYSLQVGEDANVKYYHPKFQDLSSQIKDFGDTAAAIAKLDLVISVDTAVAHLAGALGKPIWLLLPCKPDWRWMLEREDSPWYPTMRLFRQKQPGDWAEVFARVKSALLKEIDKKNT